MTGTSPSTLPGGHFRRIFVTFWWALFWSFANPALPQRASWEFCFDAAREFDVMEFDFIHHLYRLGGEFLALSAGGTPVFFAVFSGTICRTDPDSLLGRQLNPFPF